MRFLILPILLLCSLFGFSSTASAQIGVLAIQNIAQQADVTAFEGIVGPLPADTRVALNIYSWSMTQSGIKAKTCDASVLAAVNPTQALTTFYSHTVQIPNGSPAQAVNKGYQFSGTNYLDSGTNPSTCGVSVNESAMYESSNEGQTRTAFGAIGVAANNGVGIVPESGGGLLLGYARSSIVTGPATSTSLALTSLRLTSGPTYTFFQNGVNKGTGTAVGSGGLPNLNMYVGGLNNNGSFTSGRPFTGSYWWIGDALTDSQEQAHAAIVDNLMLMIGAKNTYVSSIAFGGLPIGNDANPCTLELPCLSQATGLANTPAGGVLYFNGDPNNRTAYVVTTRVISIPMTWAALQGLGSVSLQANNISSIVSVSPSVPGLYRLSNLNFDAVSLASWCIQLPTVASRATVQIENPDCNNFLNNAIETNNSNYIGDVIITNPTGDVGSGDPSLVTAADGYVNMTSVLAGSLTVTGGNITCSRQNFSGQAQIYYAAVAAGQTVTITDLNYDCHTLVMTSNVNLGIYIENAKGLITGGVHKMTTEPGSLRDCTMDLIQTGEPNGHTEYDTSNSVIDGVHYYHDCFAGGLAAMGNEGLHTLALQSNQTIKNIVVDFCGSSCQTNGTHMIFFNRTLNSFSTNNTIYAGSLCHVSKNGQGLTVTNVNVSNCISSGFLGKGDTGTTYTNSSVTQGLGYGGRMFNAEQDDVSLNFSTGNVFSGVTFTVNGSVSGVQMIAVDPGCDATFGPGVNSYQKVSGTVNTNPWTYNGTGIPLFNGVGGWQATHDANAISNLP